MTVEEEFLDLLLKLVRELPLADIYQMDAQPASQPMQSSRGIQAALQVPTSIAMLLTCFDIAVGPLMAALYDPTSCLVARLLLCMICCCIRILRHKLQLCMHVPACALQLPICCSAAELVACLLCRTCLLHHWSPPSPPTPGVAASGTLSGWRCRPSSATSPSSPAPVAGTSSLASAPAASAWPPPWVSTS